MQLRDAKLLFEAGILDTINVSPYQNGWAVKFRNASTHESMSLESRRIHKGAIRVFKSIDAACYAANRIGFDDIVVTFTSEDKNP